jgi:TPP-dependent pyruvate/acetoin dehydrogenase alpha subunit
MEIETYRHCGHVGPNYDEAMLYRPRDEVERWKARDPVLGMRERLVKTMRPAELERLEAGVEAEVNAAIAAAKRAEFADFQAILGSNWSGEYAKVVDRFRGDSKSSFESGQSEARLGPF